MNFEKYIGIPYVEKGRVDTGIDCWGLARLIYKNEYNISLPSFSAEYQTEDSDRIEELFAQYKEGWEESNSPKEGDIVVFRIFGYESHVGVAVSATHFIHSREGRDTVIESFSNPKWARRITGFYKYSEKNNAVLNTVPHPLKTERYTLAVVPGTNVSELVQNISLQYNIAAELKSRINVLINGRLVYQEDWSKTTIRENDVIEYRAVAGKSTLRLVAILALSYYAPMLAGSLTGYASATAAATIMGGQVTVGLVAMNMAAAAGIVMVGSSLINAIAPVRPPVGGSQNDAGTAERQLLVNGGQNRGNPYGAIPVVLGRMRVTPLLGSNNYLTYENERDSFLSMLLVWGYGPLDIDDNSYKIGEVPLSSFTDVTKITLDRKTEPTATVKRNFDAIYGKDVTQVNTNIELVCAGNPASSVTPGPFFQAATTEVVNSLTLALHFPQGLRRIKTRGDGAGDSFATAVQFRVEFSTDVGVNFALLDTFTVGGDSPKKDGFTFTKTYPNLNYPRMIVRIRRQTGDNAEANADNRYYFTSILQNATFLRNANPAVDPVGAKIAKTAFKIRATDQLNGNIEGISALVQTYCKIYNGATWVDGATSNPAALMRYILEHPANPRKVTDANNQINLTELQYFYDYCETNGFEYNSILGDARSVLEVIRDVCAAGRASPALIDGKWTVVIDQIKSNIVQHFTPHNSFNFEGSKILPKRPDGLRITYYDQEKDFQESEIIVYEIGKNDSNASLFESITLPGVTKTSLVIDHARWHLAQMKLRPEIYTIDTDIEYLVCNRGDRVKVMYDVPLWGSGSGRIKNRLSNTQLELDEDVTMKANVQYTIRFRSKTGDSLTRNLVPKNEDGYYTIIDLTSSVTVAEADYGDLFLFGTLNEESQDLMVLSIEPNSNNAARITMVDYGVTAEYNIFTEYLTLSESTTFESQITLPPTMQIQGFGDKIPSITGFVSDESVMERVSKTVFKYNINVAYFNASDLPIVVDTVEVQYDLDASDTSVNFTSIFVPFQKGSANITDVKENETYKIRMRYVGRNGKLGNWTPYSVHTVVGKTSAPSNVTLLTISSDKSSGQLLLSWHPNPEYDVSTYEVRTEDTGFGVEDFRRVFYGDATKTFVKYRPSGSANFYVRAVDSSGNYSLSSVVVSFTPDVIPNVSDIDFSYADTALTSATITLTWSDVVTSEFDVAFYELAYESTIRTVKANNITLAADWLGDRLFTIKTVDIQGNKSSGYSELIAKLAPNPPFDIRTQVVDNNVMLFWTLPARTSLPIDHILLKKGATYASATVIGDKKGAFTSISENIGGDFTYWLAAVDTEGVESQPASITTTVAEPPDFIFNASFNSTFTGTKSFASFDGSVLALPINTTETFEQHFTTRSWATPQAQVTAGFPVFIQPSGGTGFYEETFDFGQPLASSRILLIIEGRVVAGSPVVVPKISLSLDNSTYVDYNGVTDVFGTNFRYIKIRVTVSEPTNIGLYEISQLTVRLDAKLKNDTGTVQASSSDTLGTIVNFTKEFIDVQSINLSPSAITPVISVYDIKDAFVTGTYSVSSNTCTITINAHGLVTGQNIKFFANSGIAITGVYTITAHTTNTMTISMPTANTTGGCSMYPQSFRIYLFNNSGTRVSSTTSWSIKGY
jgi:hypothetical protein